MTKICIPIVEKTLAKIHEQARTAKVAGANLVEIWLGEIADCDVPELFAGLPLPALVNCKDAKEKGNFTGTDKEKADLLIAAAQAGAKYIDIDHEFDSELLKKIQAKKGAAELILSAHFFNGTPGLPHLTSKLAKMLERKPDMVKFAAMPHSLRDVVTMIRLAEKLQSKNIPHIVISMGELGKLTRVASPVLGNAIMFATMDESKASAPGQINAKKLAEYYEIW